MPLTKLNTSSLPSGSVLQVQSVNKVDNQTISGTTFDDVMSVSITPRSTNSKILVQCNLNVSCASINYPETGQRYSAVKLYRDSTQIAVNTDKLNSQTAVWFAANTTEATNSGYAMNHSAGTFIDTPSSTSAITYKVTVGNTYSSTVKTFINRPSKDNNDTWNTIGTSTLTVMEIAG